MASKLPHNVSDWDPGSGGAHDAAKHAKLMSTDAREDMDNVTKSNPQKAFKGKSGKPSGPYGLKGRNF